MGTVFTIDIRDPGDWADAVDGVVRWLHHVDRVFSTYQVDSDVSRINRAELTVARADPLVADVLELCAQVAVETEGHFTARRGRGLDPTGLVKGWAIERASEFLRVAGSRNHAVNGGGDIQFAGEVAPGEPWTVGISDPTDSQRVLTVITGRDFAVATSGSAERGSHIDNPFTGEPAGGILSATVAGPSLTRVDCYATAAFVMGNAALSWIEHLPGHAAMIVPSDSQPLATRSFARLIAQHSADEPTRPRY